MALNLIQNFSFEAGLTPWKSAGGASAITPLVAGAFEGTSVGALGPLTPPVPMVLNNAVLSQLFVLPPDTVNLRVSYAIRRLLPLVVFGEVQVQIVWQGGPGYDIIDTEILEVLPGGLIELELPLEWQTHVITTGPKPADAVQAYIRFVLLNTELGVDGVYIDEVVVTAET
jgi:hypothetical protein